MMGLVKKLSYDEKTSFVVLFSYLFLTCLNLNLPSVQLLIHMFAVNLIFYLNSEQWTVNQSLRSHCSRLFDDLDE